MTTKTEIACRCCGVATDQRITRQVANDAFGRPRMEYDAGVCDACESLRPDEVGSEVRAALRLLGKDEADWPLAAEAFADAPPVLYERAAPQRRAWAHVERETKAELKRAYVRVLDARVHASADHDRPVPPHTPPDGYPRACLACGVARSAQWYSLRTKVLTPGPDFVDGCLCGETCAPVYEEVGAAGPRLVERAAMRAKGVGFEVRGVKAWAATGLPPREVGFDWVEAVEPEPDLDPLLALQVAVRDLTARLDALEGKQP